MRDAALGTVLRETRTSVPVSWMMETRMIIDMARIGIPNLPRDDRAPFHATHATASRVSLPLPRQTCAGVRAGSERVLAPGVCWRLVCAGARCVLACQAGGRHADRGFPKVLTGTNAPFIPDPLVLLVVPKGNTAAKHQGARGTPARSKFRSTALPALLALRKGARSSRRSQRDRGQAAAWFIVCGVGVVLLVVEAPHVPVLHDILGREDWVNGSVQRVAHPEPVRVVRPEARPKRLLDPRHGAAVEGHCGGELGGDEGEGQPVDEGRPQHDDQDVPRRRVEPARAAFVLRQCAAAEACRRARRDRPRACGPPRQGAEGVR